jgi:predicted ArsR family transcriptional regulator
MFEMLGNRQQELLRLLLRNKDGLTVDELAQRLQITRNAVRQHLASLETDRLVEPGRTRPSGGRPQQLYGLTDKGKECFPRHYAWFAQLLVESIKQETGPDELRERLDKLGENVATQLRSQNPGLQTPLEKLIRLAELMAQLGYDVAEPRAEGAESILEADNCVFHSLATKDPDICRFDLALLSTFTDSEVVHEACMAHGEHTCRFRFKPKTV